MYVKYCFSAIVVYFVFIVPSSVSNMITLFKWFTLVVIFAKKCNILCADFGLLSQKWLVFYKIINNQYIFLILKKIIRFHSTINDKITLCALLKIHTTFFSINIPTMHLIFLFYKFLSRSEKNLKNLLFSHFLYISTYLCSINIRTWSSAPIVD